MTEHGSEGHIIPVHDTPPSPPLPPFPLLLLEQAKRSAEPRMRVETIFMRYA
jgi:hypothetical protein